jgi:hypothetical protein
MAPEQAETFADVIREVVGDNTQRDVAEWGDVSHTYVNDWLQHRKPTLKTLRKFVDRLEARGRLKPGQRERMFRTCGYVDPGRANHYEEHVGQDIRVTTGMVEEIVRRAVEETAQRLMEQSPADQLLEGLDQLAADYPDLQIPVPSFSGGVRSLTPERVRDLIHTLRQMAEEGLHPKKSPIPSDPPHTLRCDENEQTTG